MVQTFKSDEVIGGHVWIQVLPLRELFSFVFQTTTTTKLDTSHESRSIRIRGEDEDLSRDLELAQS